MLKEINIKELDFNPVKQFDDNWALLTSGSTDDYNTMTVSWGALGELWNRDVAICFVRPERYTFEFMEKNEYFTLSYFSGNYKKELGFCGSRSGRDFDKAKETGLEPITVENSTSFEQADVILLCRKIAFQDMKPDGFVDESIADNYRSDGLHRTYVGEIVKAFVNE